MKKKMSIFHLNFVQEAYLIYLKEELEEEVSLKRNVYDFSVHCDAIDNPDVLIIYKYLMVKNKLKHV